MAKFKNIGCDDDVDYDPLDTEPAFKVIHNKCLCGRVATLKCHEIWSANTLVPCNEWLCANGCTRHRHAAGSMGYPGTMKGRTHWVGIAPDSDGIIAWLKAWWQRNFWSAQQKADLVWREQQEHFPPPAPWPHIQLFIGDRLFEAKGPDGMREVTKFSEELPLR